MLTLMKEFDLCNRHFWAFDSFEGLPAPLEDDKKRLAGEKGVVFHFKLDA